MYLFSITDTSLFKYKKLFAFIHPTFEVANMRILSYGGVLWSAQNGTMVGPVNPDITIRRYEHLGFPLTYRPLNEGKRNRTFHHVPKSVSYMTSCIPSIMPIVMTDVGLNHLSYLPSYNRHRFIRKTVSLV